MPEDDTRARRQYSATDNAMTRPSGACRQGLGMNYVCSAFSDITNYQRQPDAPRFCPNSATSCDTGPRGVIQTLRGPARDDRRATVLTL